ncbi:MAG: hypothetical protein E7A06_01920 [Clostridiales bacterium]|nr:hypothetical protein [Clostridiales bacterium]
MLHDLFGEITFNTGWKSKKTIRVFDKEYTINLKIQAYFEEDGITEEQENAYSEFCKSENEKLETVENLLRGYSDSPEQEFIPKTLLINRDGSYALLCDDIDNEDEGIAVCLYPEEVIISQDDYL